MQDCLCHDSNAIERAAGRGGGIDVARDICQLLQQLHRDQQQRAGDGVQQAAEMTGANTSTRSNFSSAVGAWPVRDEAAFQRGKQVL